MRRRRKKKKKKEDEKEEEEGGGRKRRRRKMRRRRKKKEEVEDEKEEEEEEEGRQLGFLSCICCCFLDVGSMTEETNICCWKLPRPLFELQTPPRVNDEEGPESSSVFSFLFFSPSPTHRNDCSLHDVHI